MPFATTAEAIARRNIITVDDNDSVFDAISLMVTESIGCIVVTSRGRPVGIITERDLMRKVILQGMDTKQVLTREIMSTPLITINADASLGEAALMMYDKRIRRLLVEKGGNIIGIFTQRDLENAALGYFLAVAKIT